MAAFLKILQEVDVPPTPEAIFSRYTDHQRRIRRWVQAGRIDVVKAALCAVMKTLQPPGAFDRVQNSRKQWRSLGKFLADLREVVRQAGGGDKPGTTAERLRAPVPGE